MTEREVKVVSLDGALAEAKANRLIPFADTESFAVAAQKIDGPHTFRHLNEAHDELIVVMAGRLTLWTGQGERSLTAGEAIVIPKGVEHGDLVGEGAKILVMEGK